MRRATQGRGRAQTNQSSRTPPMSFIYPDKSRAGYQPVACPTNCAEHCHFNTGSLALLNPCSHLYPLQINNKSNQRPHTLLKSLHNTNTKSNLNVFLLRQELKKYITRQQEAEKILTCEPWGLETVTSFAVPGCLQPCSPVRHGLEGYLCESCFVCLAAFLQP